MKRRIRITLALLLSVLCLSGCMRRFKEIKVTSATLEEVRPDGLRNFDAVIGLGISNPAPSFNILHLQAEIRKDTLEIAHASAENIAVDGKTERVYSIPVRGGISDGVSLLRVALMLRNFKPEEYTVDVHARASIAGVGKNLEFTGIPLSDLMKKSEE